MSLQRLLRALPWFHGPSGFSEELRAIGVNEPLDVALAEWGMVGGFDDLELFLEWLANWPPPPGMSKPNPKPDRFRARVNSLIATGVLRREADELRAGPKLTGALAGYPETVTKGNPKAPLPFEAAVAAVGGDPATRKTRAEEAVGLLEGTELAIEKSELATMPENARGIAEALCAACADDAFRSAAIESATRLAAHLSAASHPPRPGTLLFVRFATEIAVWFRPEWLEVTAERENVPRREHFVRVWAHYAGIPLLVDGEEQAPSRQAAELLQGDPRRAERWALETELQDRIVDEAGTRIGAELARKKAQSQAYASGRRE